MNDDVKSWRPLAIGLNTAQTCTAEIGILQKETLSRYGNVNAYSSLALASPLLHELTCHVESQSVTSQQVIFAPLPQPIQTELDLATTEECKAELT